MTAAVLASIVLPAGAQAPRLQQPTGGWCADGHATPCISAGALQHPDGTTYHLTGSGDPHYALDATLLDAASNGGENLLLWNVQPGTDELLATDTWSMTFQLGTVVPRITGTDASGVIVHRTAKSDGTYQVTITAHPTRHGVDNCDQSVMPWTCYYQAHTDRVLLQGQIDDFGQWDDAQQRHDVYGMDLWGNVEATSVPPQFVGSPVQVLVELANSHTWSTGEVVHGFYTVDVPNAFAKDLGMDDPASMTPSSVTGSIGSGAVQVAPSATSVRIAISNITFPGPGGTRSAHARTASFAPRAARHSSMRVLNVRRGVAYPTRPGHISAVRSTIYRARVAFTASAPRGSRITGYQARCTAPRRAAHWATGSRSALVVTKLVPGVRYACAARATSRAGVGYFSPGVLVRGRP